MKGIRANTIQKYKRRTLPWLKKKAIRVFNRWIRERDRRGNYFICGGCGKSKRIQNYDQGGSNYHAGHYYPAGKFEALRFDEVNVNGECVQCNHYSGDHLIGLGKTIVERHGKEELERIDMVSAHNKRNGHKWDRLDLIAIIEKYSK